MMSRNKKQSEREKCWLVQLVNDASGQKVTVGKFWGPMESHAYIAARKEYPHVFEMIGAQGALRDPWRVACSDVTAQQQEVP